MANRTRASVERGSTLVELAVGIAVLAAVLQQAIPSLASALASSAVRGAAEQLLADLHLARTEALLRNGRVALCKSADGELCGAAASWHQGWLVFDDANNNGLREPSETVLARREAFGGDVRVLANNPLADYISYDGVGLARKTTGAFQAGTLTVCRGSASATEAREVILNALGRPRVQRTIVASC